VACATHPLAGRQGLTLQDIANERLAPQQWGTGCDELILQLRLLRQVTSPLHANVTDLPPDHWDVMMAWRSGKRPNPAKERVLEAARTLARRWSGKPA